ncbi:sigma-70 family RNA polymerase sigma factor [Paeniclostridium sordellii]|uniref:RNA polymerase sigma factor n=1 Tax=Paraclostridium sordellii TaxID=1505 RepID=UPI001F05F14C|nr:sigma-70 family RNA polymerase sigma factor [Paeniclostridium sordellii]MCH1964643.1 sigma-70 family RNA polymerase sigma factor [Paeniclostridium sordellii]MCQ4699160.1 sigma-70 family RNA polymerase sigma factor [Paeniclostridium sordellii]MDU6482819.1 sigma-70 family RNA polymerase sigma factor [Paeniclostridium sordellii]
MMKELKLIKKINKKNDRRAANELISLYYKEIYKYIYIQLSDKDLAMDITQEVFINMLEGLHRFDESKALFRTWLYKIATNKIIDYYRSKQYKYRNLFEDIDSIEIKENNDFIVKLENKEDVEKIQGIVNNLDTYNQEIFRLKIFSEMKFDEISEILNIPVSTIKSKYYRLISKVKNEFNYKGGANDE